ncbi:MAG: hypothetical protein KGQ60_00705 [Planctomycetes bacterium]|nr:hypothetical protein [Planctomycetota bacterium]
MEIDTDPSSDSLLGQLQRGRGAGYLKALAVPRDVAQNALLDAICYDWRFDRQLEKRAHYYAWLARDLRLPLELLDRHLRERDDRSIADRRSQMALAVLSIFAYWGSTFARQSLQEYVSYGFRLWDVLCHLEDDMDEALAGDIADRLFRRIPDPAKFAEECRVYDWYFEPEMLAPYWKQHSGLVWMQAMFTDKADEEHIETATQAKIDFQDEALSVEEVFRRIAAGETCQEGHLKEWIKANIRPNDIGMLLEIVTDETDHFSKLPGRSQVVRAAHTGLESLSAEVMLPFARESYKSPNRTLRRIAFKVLKGHGSEDDMRLMCSMMTPSLLANDMYQVCDIIEALRRFPGLGITELEEAFRGATYSWARALAAESLRISASDLFRESYAFECLWDSEERIWCIGCQAVDLDNPLIRERVRFLITIADHPARLEKAIAAVIDGPIAPIAGSRS